MNTPPPRKRSAIFVDRDGTVMEEVHYCREPEKVRLFEGVIEALRLVKEAGFCTVLITNQSGIARGTITHHEYEAVHARLLELLGPDILDATYMCPDGPTTPSTRRKPAPGMLLEAAADLDLDLSSSWMIGDKEVDVGCGNNAGASSILVRTGHGASITGDCGALHTAKDLPSALHWILSRPALSQRAAVDSVEIH